MPKKTLGRNRKVWLAVAAAVVATGIVVSFILVNMAKDRSSDPTNNNSSSSISNNSSSSEFSSSAPNTPPTPTNLNNIPLPEVPTP